METLDDIYECFDKSKISLTYTDTDSLFLAASETALEQCARTPDLFSKFSQKYFDSNKEVYLKIDAEGDFFVAPTEKNLILADVNKDANGVQQFVSKKVSLKGVFVAIFAEEAR